MVFLFRFFFRLRPRNQRRHLLSWSDPDLFTVRGMQARGYRPEAIEQWWKDMGMKRGNIDAPFGDFEFTKSSND